MSERCANGAYTFAIRHRRPAASGRSWDSLRPAADGGWLHSDGVARARASTLSAADAERVVVAIEALADSIEVRVVSALHGADGLSTAELAAVLGLTNATIERAVKRPCHIRDHSRSGRIQQPPSSHPTRACRGLRDPLAIAGAIPALAASQRPRLRAPVHLPRIDGPALLDVDCTEAKAADVEAPLCTRTPTSASPT